MNELPEKGSRGLKAKGLRRVADTWWALPLPVFLGVSAAYAVARSGVGIDGLARPFVEELVPSLPRLPPWPPLYHFLFYSPIGAINARLLGISTLGPYVAMHVVVLVLGLGCTAWVINRAYGADAARLIAVLFAISQVPTMLLQRLGGYDPYSVVFAGLASTAVFGPWGIFLGIGWSWAASEQALLSLAGLLGLHVLLRRPLRPLLWIGAGLAIGRVALQIWLHSASVKGSRLDWIRHFGLRMFVDMFVQGLPWLVLTGAGAVPVFAAIHLAQMTPGRTPRGRVAAAWGLTILLPLFAVVLVDDEGRVLSALQWPLLVVMGLVAAGSLSTARLSRISALVSVLALAVPAVLVSHGKVFLASHHVLRLLPWW